MYPVVCRRKSGRSHEKNGAAGPVSIDRLGTKRQILSTRHWHCYQPLVGASLGRTPCACRPRLSADPSPSTSKRVSLAGAHSFATGRHADASEKILLTGGSDC